MISNRDESSALLQLVNQWLNFTYTHVLTFSVTEARIQIMVSTRIELTTSRISRCTWLPLDHSRDGTHVIGRALDVLSVYDRLGRNVIGLHDARRRRLQPSIVLATLCTAAVTATARMEGRKVQGGVGPAVKSSIKRAAHPPELQ